MGRIAPIVEELPGFWLLRPIAQQMTTDDWTWVFGNDRQSRILSRRESCRGPGEFAARA